MAEPKDSLTVVETVYHRAISGKITEVDSRFSRELETCEQPYERQLVATEEWQPLDFGWLKDNVGMFVLVNEAGKDRTTKPTEEEKQELSEQWLQIMYSVIGTEGREGWIVPPGETMRGYPMNPSGLYIRCHRSNAPFTIRVFPK